MKLERSKCILKCEFYCKYYSIIKYKIIVILFFEIFWLIDIFFYNNLYCYIVLLDMVFMLILSKNFKGFMILFLNNKLEWIGLV